MRSNGARVADVVKWVVDNWPVETQRNNQNTGHPSNTGNQPNTGNHTYRFWSPGDNKSKTNEGKRDDGLSATAVAGAALLVAGVATGYCVGASAGSSGTGKPDVIEGETIEFEAVSETEEVTTTQDGGPTTTKKKRRTKKTTMHRYHKGTESRDTIGKRDSTSAPDVKVAGKGRNRIDQDEMRKAMIAALDPTP